METQWFSRKLIDNPSVLMVSANFNQTDRLKLFIMVPHMFQFGPVVVGPKSPCAKQSHTSARNEKIRDFQCTQTSCHSHYCNFNESAYLLCAKRSQSSAAKTMLFPSILEIDPMNHVWYGTEIEGCHISAICSCSELCPFWKWIRTINSSWVLIDFHEKFIENHR